MTGSFCRCRRANEIKIKIRIIITTKIIIVIVKSVDIDGWMKLPALKYEELLDFVGVQVKAEIGYISWYMGPVTVRCCPAMRWCDCRLKKYVQCFFQLC